MKPPESLPLGLESSLTEGLARVRKKDGLGIIDICVGIDWRDHRYLNILPGYYCAVYSPQSVVRSP